jgi:YVTN family beta-propeller protein
MRDASCSFGPAKNASPKVAARGAYGSAQKGGASHGRHTPPNETLWRVYATVGESNTMIRKWMRSALAGMAALSLCYLGMPSTAQTTPHGSLLALSKRDHTLAIVDPAALEVIARLPVGPDPHEVVASTDGTKAYVSIYGFGRYHTLSVLDLVAQKALPDIETGALTGPHGLGFVGGKVWFTAEGAKAIARFDPATGTVDWIMGTGQNRTHMLYVTADEKQIYTTNVSSGTVSIIEKVVLSPMGPPPGTGSQAREVSPPVGRQPQTGWNETVLTVGKGDEGFDVSPDARELWTANAQDGTLSIIDLTSKKVTATVDAKIYGSNRLKFSPDGKLVFITSLRDGNLFIYDVRSRNEYKRVPIGHGAAGILMDPVADRAFVACTPDNYLSVIDLKTLKVTGHVDVGGEPDGLAWARGR